MSDQMGPDQIRPLLVNPTSIIITLSQPSPPLPPPLTHTHHHTPDATHTHYDHHFHGSSTQVSRLTETVESHLDAIAGLNPSLLGGVDREDLRQQGKGLLTQMTQVMTALKGGN